MQDFISWFLTSSADPKQTSLAIKGILTAVLPFVALVGIDNTIANEAVVQIANFVEAVLVFVGACMTFVGFLRKLNLGRWAHPEA